MSKKTVMVGMSGGVDSSTVAAILQSEGWEVIGVTLQLYTQEKIVGNSKTCCGSKDTFDAKMVCANLGIRHYVINYESNFKKDVIDDFVQSYKSGFTPIPCVKCNQSVKFRDMLKVSQDLGIDYMATGHYVQRIEKNGEILMAKGVDLTKDQSYFLFATTKDQLSKTLFPLGSYTKIQTREIAEKFGLINAKKRESQDICFIPDGDYGNFLLKFDKTLASEGDIILQKTGKIIGKHKGAVFYTIGQRRGIGVGGSEKPLFVTKISIEENKVFVGFEDELYQSEFEIFDVNFLSSKFENLEKFECNVVCRALKPEIKAEILRLKGGRYLVKLSRPERAITKGQACVMYDGDIVIGGGWIG